MMETRQLQLEVRWLVRGILVAVLAACSAAAGAQSGGQSTPQSAAPTPGRAAVAPPPADLEPGVNTSATQTSSAEPELPPAKAAPQKTAPTPAKPAKAAAGAASAGAASALPSASNADAAAAGTPRTSAVPKPGAPGAGAGKAHDSLQLDTTQITGNRELPKVLYIVPWKRSDLGDLVGKPVNSLLDEVLTPVDRDVFKRQNRYYEALKPDAAKDAAGAAQGTDVKH
jgi:hypothetical protein